MAMDTNAVGISIVIPPPATTQNGDRELSLINHIFLMGMGDKASRGLISRDITKKGSYPGDEYFPLFNGGILN